MDWAHVEARVGAQFGRPLRVFVCGSAANAGVSTVTTGDALNASEHQPHSPLGLFLELPYALRVALGARVDVWLQTRNCVSKVQKVTWYATSKAQDDEELCGSEKAGDASLRSALLALSTDVGVDTDRDNWQQEAVTHLLVDVAQKLVVWFASLQMQDLKALNHPRPAFELELLQHQLGLEPLVTSNQQRSQHFVEFVLPLFRDEPSWNEEAAISGLGADSFYLPNTFNYPNFAREIMDQIVLQTRLELDATLTTGNSIDWKFTIHWPNAMALSSQVTQIPHASKTSSSIELVATCKENILNQWRKRRDFVAHLRSKAIVLEYDAVDFSSAVLMLQEQLDQQSPLRIVLLRLRFTAEYFLTNCYSDLQVSLLDGVSLDAPVVIRLDPSSSSTPDSAPESIVAAFLESLSRSVLSYFYALSRISRLKLQDEDATVESILQLVGTPIKAPTWSFPKWLGWTQEAMMENMMKSLIGKGKSEEDERKQKKSDSSYQGGNEYSTGDSAQGQDSSSHPYGQSSKDQTHRDTRTSDYLGGSSDDPSASSTYSDRSGMSGYTARKKRNNIDDDDDDSQGYRADDSSGSSYQSEYTGGYQPQSSSRDQTSPYQSSTTSKKHDKSGDYSSSASSRGASYGSGRDDPSYSSGSCSKDYDD